MEYGLVGEKLGHSFSKEIHNILADYAYELNALRKEDFDAFFKAKNFKAINVTIPYKRDVIPYLDFIDAAAENIGAVNTVVNRDGKLYGYNTDFYGLERLALHLRLSFKDKKVAILGTGGTSRTASAVAKSLGARKVLRVSRESGKGDITYDELYKKHSDVEIIINTTPLGMYPDIFSSPVDLSHFENLVGVIDTIYNPLRTKFISDAIKMGVRAEGGLYMLVAQAVRASEIFIDMRYPDDTVDKIFKTLRAKKENTVLIGMPASGKSTVGKIIAEKLSLPFIDTDELIEKNAKMSIPDIFRTFGEEKFRDMEREAIKSISAVGGAVIATGGGAILRCENVEALKQNGRLFFIDRPLDALVPTDTRPLSRDREAIEARYNERYGIYSAVCDVKIQADCDALSVAKRIMEEIQSEDLYN